MILFAAVLLIAVLSRSSCDYTSSYRKILHPSFYPSNRVKHQNSYWFAENIIRTMPITGKILNRYEDQCDHFVKTIDIALQDQYIYLHPDFMFDIGPERCRRLYLSCNPGDSVFKKQGSLVMTVKHNGYCQYFGLSTKPEYSRDTVYCK